MPLITYLCNALTWIYLFSAGPSPVWSANGECDVNICDEGDPGFLCDAGSIIVIQQVMCRTRGRNCDMIAFRETMRLCAGRQYCDSSDLWLVSGKYCERNDRKQFLSIVFVSYACVKVKAVASDCSQRGTNLPTYQRYLSSPGYPALVTGNSVCTWRLHPPPGLHADIFIREYLHLDSTEQQYLRIREMALNGDVLNLARTSKRELTTTIAGDVEISLNTDDSKKGHRMFIEYRYVTPPLEHLRPFPVPNKTECGASLLNKTVFPGRHGNPNDIIKPVPNIPLSSTLQTTPSSPVLTTPQTTSYEEITPPTSTTTTTASQLNITGTEVRENSPSNTALIVATAVCAVGVSCCVVAIVIGCRHRKRKKSSAHGRNCLTTDSYSVEYDRASLSSTPSSHPYSRPSPLVTSPRHYPHHAERVDFVRQSEIVHLKPGFHSPQDTIIEASPFEDTYSGHGQLDRNGVPLDLSKYLITDSDNTMDTSTSKASSRSSNGHIYDVVREH